MKASASAKSGHKSSSADQRGQAAAEAMAKDLRAENKRWNLPLLSWKEGMVAAFLGIVAVAWWAWPSLLGASDPASGSRSRDAPDSPSATEGKVPRARTAERRSRPEPPGPHDRRLRRLFSDDPTGIRADQLTGFLAQSEGRPEAVLACCLLTDRDPGLVSKLASFGDSPVVAWFLPYLGVGGRRGEGMGGAVEGGFKHGMSGEESREWVNAVLKEGPIDLSPIQEVRVQMRAALGSLGIEGSRAEILIEQTFVSPEMVVGRWSSSLREAWTEGRRGLSGAELRAFDERLLWVLSESFGQAAERSLPSLQLKSTILGEIEGSEQVAPRAGTTAGVERASVERSIEAMKGLNEGVYHGLTVASPETVDRYLEIKRTDENEADRFLIEATTGMRLRHHQPGSLISLTRYIRRGARDGATSVKGGPASIH